jgi:hypothetical protein
MIECRAGDNSCPGFIFQEHKKLRVAGHAHLGKKNAIGIV